MLLVLLGLILVLWLAIQTTPVQNWLVDQATSTLSRNLKTSVRIRHVDFSFFNRMKLEGTLIKDRNNDTLLYAGALLVNITDWFFVKDKIELHYIGLKDASIRLQRTDSVWNYAFLVDYFSGGKKSGQKKKVTLNLEELELDHIDFLQRDAWRGEDMRMQLGQLLLKPDEFDLDKKKIHFDNVNIVSPSFYIKDYDGNRPDSLRPKYVKQKIKNDPLHLRWNPDNWDIRINHLALIDGEFGTDRPTNRAPYPYFDGNHIRFTDIQGNFEKVRWQQDSITAITVLSTRERSGLQVKELTTHLKFYPEAMEFNNLDLQTNRSRLRNYYAMRFDSFDDLSDFISHVKLEGDFNNSTLSSDDIAFFAPELADWHKAIRLKGKIKGTIDNLQSRGLEIEAGNSSYLNGDIRMTGLPDIEKTYIDFKANNFRTTYNDALAIIPELKTVYQPRLDKLEWLRFRGNFTGFIRDFVTYGTIETNLGTVVSDLNMKLPAGSYARYSGNISTDNFDLGSFLEVDRMGKISFKGKVNGDGIKPGNLSANLDGTISKLEYRDYAYQDLAIKGKVAKKLFNGSFTSADPNLNLQLNGLIDFSGELPRFDFDANIARADLKKLNIGNENVEFAGQFRLNFSGNDVDNFLGTARVSNAVLYHDSLRLPFDSLYVESKVLDANRTITVLSNEFDAALVGEFSVKDLPLAFETFLSKYYPSYFQPARQLQKNENFSFVITTKNVDDYLHIFTKDIKGFNYSTLTGRINGQENLLDLNAEIPQFSYKNISIYNLNLKGTGNYDSLTVQSDIADVYINDSLHFPGTSIAVNAAGDLSRFSINTSANQALNTANLNGSVETRKNGFKIIFDDSQFDINGKNWVIAKNGELVLSKDLVFAEGLRFYTGQQEVRITTHPSDIGYTNDIKVELNKINIGDFTPYFVRSNRLEGLLTGSVDIINPFGKVQIEMSGEAEQFRLDDDSIGVLALNANYMQQTGKVNFAAESDNKNYHFDLKGLYNSFDSTSDQPLDIRTHFTETRINLLERYLSSVFSEVDGFASGDLRIVGQPSHPDYLGKADLRDGHLKVNYTNVSYRIPRATIEFRHDTIDFGTLTLRDTLNHPARLTRGILKHESFRKMYFDFALSTNNLLVLNTDGLDNEAYFGRVFAKASMSFTGPIENMVMNIRGEPSDSSDLHIRSGSGRVSGQADFVVWKVYGREMKEQAFSNESKLTVNVDVAANNLANMYVIIDELTGDIIKANGHGNLKIRATTDGEFTITGQYDIDRGNYNFNFQSLLHKPFKLQEEAGSYIRWNGDPYDAEMYVVAAYEADNVKFSDLGDRLWLQTGSSDESIKKYRGKIKVLAYLTGKLMRPEIKFDLEMPSSSPLKNDPIVLNILKQIKSDENELNKQVAFLIIFNSFGPLSTSSQSSLGNQAFEGIVASSISGYLSGALSKQFSTIFRKIFNDESIKVNFNAQLYNGSNLLDIPSNNAFAINRTNLSLSLDKNFFNERLTFTFGSSVDFGLTSEQVRATRNLQFLPDITAEWKIRPDGKLVLTFFYRDTFTNLSTAGTKQNRSGASISYRRDFEHFGDLWRNDKKKKKNGPQDSGNGNAGPQGSQ